MRRWDGRMAARLGAAGAVLGARVVIPAGPAAAGTFPVTNDRLKGLGGADRECAGPGKDRLSGGAGKDRLRGEGGRDTIRGGGGNDRHFGGPGADTCVGGGGKRDRATSCAKERGIP